MKNSNYGKFICVNTNDIPHIAFQAVTIYRGVSRRNESFKVMHFYIIDRICLMLG